MSARCCDRCLLARALTGHRALRSPRLACTATVKRVGLVKGDVAAAVEDQLLSMAQSGQLQARVEESQVKDMLAKTSTTRAEKKVTITRRNVMSDEEDNDDDLL